MNPLLHKTDNADEATHNSVGAIGGTFGDTEIRTLDCSVRNITNNETSELHNENEGVRSCPIKKHVSRYTGFSKSNTIYMDYQATTPTDPRVVDVIVDSMKNNFGNPHSASHIYGWEAKDEIEVARGHVASLINAKTHEIIFTSGATEANNWALCGIAEFYKDEGKNHVITSAIEHKCILQTCKYLATKGCKITVLKPNEDGLINLDELEKSITPQTCLISIMLVNNEVGTIQNIQRIGEIAHKHGTLLHTDAAQAFGKIKIDVEKMNIDLMSISSHKVYGPKGVGALYIRSKPKVRIKPLIYGGGQERGLRGGTLPTSLIAGFGEAARLAYQEMEQNTAHINYLTKKLMKGLLAIPHTSLNGSAVHRIPGNLNINFAFVEGESAMMSFPHIAVSSGSACTSVTLEPSYVLKALGLKELLAHSSLRFGVGKFTTEEEVEQTIKQVTEGIKRMRDMSPLWEMFNNGVDIDSINWTK